MTAITALFEALLLSGVSMAVAGTSSPASGGEHLISHFLDMTADCAPEKRTPALHGEQVGVGTRVTTRMYAKLLSLDVDSIDWRRARASAVRSEDVGRKLTEQAPWIPPGLRARFVAESTKKLDRLAASPSARVVRVRDSWQDIREHLSPEVHRARRYRSAMRDAAAPETAAEIGVSRREFAVAVRLARFVRDRYTVLDLVGDLGLRDALEPEVLDGIA